MNIFNGAFRLMNNPFMQYFFIIGGNLNRQGPVQIDGYGKGGDILPLNKSMQQFARLKTSGPGKLSIMFDLQLAKIIRCHST